MCVCVYELPSTDPCRSGCSVASSARRFSPSWRVVKSMPIQTFRMQINCLSRRINYARRTKDNLISTCSILAGNNYNNNNNSYNYVATTWGAIAARACVPREAWPVALQRASPSSLASHSESHLAKYRKYLWALFLSGNHSETLRGSGSWENKCCGSGSGDCDKYFIKCKTKWNWVKSVHKVWRITKEYLVSQRHISLRTYLISSALLHKEWKIPFKNLYKVLQSMKVL